MDVQSNPRFHRGLAIAQAGGVRQLRPQLWSVPSASNGGCYLVDFAGDVPACTCPDFADRGGSAEFQGCKHLFAALIHTKKLEIPAGMTDAQAEKRPTYRQDWPNYELAQQHEREHFECLLRDLCGGIVSPPRCGRGRGRPRKALADVVFALVLRVYIGLSSRRASSDVRAAETSGLISEMISPKTLNHYLGDESLTVLLRTLIRESASPLAHVEQQFAVDASGFSTCTYQRWFDVKHGRERRKQQWVKAHLVCGVSTHIVTEVVVTDGHANDCPHLAELVESTAKRFNMDEVSADKAYLSYDNLGTIEAVGAVPYIPFKSGTTGEGPAVWRKAWALYLYKNEEFRRHYHARSNVETVFSMIKRKFGAAVRGKKFTVQCNEVLCKVLAHNLCVLVTSMYELDITAEFWVQPDEGGPDVH